VPIDKLNSTAAIIAALRAEMNNRTEPVGRRSARKPETPSRAADVHDIQELKRQLADLVKPVALNDPKAVQSVRPQVIRAILLWQFGPTLRDHPDWQPMLETITRSLEQHPPHEAQFLQLLSDLKH
jgi:hypothetical protein